MTAKIRTTLRLTPEMMARIEQGMQKVGQYSFNAFVLQCIEAYLDEVGEALGSRGYAAKRLREQMEKIESLILWQSLQNQMVTSRGLFTVLDELAPEDAEKDPPTPDIQIRMANDHARQLLGRFLYEQGSIVDDVTEYRRKLKKDKK